MKNKPDELQIVLPFKAEYVSIARLVVSGIASRIGFDIEVIEDIKVATSEVCNKLVRTGSKNSDGYSIKFEIAKDSFIAKFFCDDDEVKCIFASENEELALSIISALMDEVEFCPSNSYLLSMSKRLERNS